MTVASFTTQDLRRQAGRSEFDRGRRLTHAVSDLYEDEWSLCATVHDGEEFLAILHHRCRPLRGECDCPGGAPGPLCEHAVAVGLYYLSGEDEPG